MRLWVVTSAVCAGLLIGPEALGSGQVYVSDCDHGRVRPKEVTFYCGDAFAYMEDIRWRRWGGSIAVGSGVYSEKTCVPECATGGVRRHHATIWLGDVGHCSGRGSRRFYRRAKVTDVRQRLPRLCP